MNEISIYTFADIINAELVVLRYPNQNGRWMARFDGCETKDSEHSAGLLSEHGNDVTAEDAIRDYIKKISGKWLVFNAMSDTNRKMYVAPKGLYL